MAVGVTVIGPIADAAKIVTRVGDDLVDAAGNIYKKLDGSDTFTDINGNSFQLDNNGDLVRVEVPDVVVNTLTGTRTSIPPNADPETVRSLTRENESAEALARNGFDVEQNPNVGGANNPNSNPDYLINGEIFDNYAPISPRARNIASEIESKVIKKGQTENVIVNLTDTSVTPQELHQQLTDYPIEALNRVVVIDKNNNVIELDL